jgi:beta-phosphoglucomutase
MIKACIFDLDGVVVDTARYHFLAWKRLAGDLGFDFTEEQNERLKGVSRMDSLEILIEIGNLNLSRIEKERLAGIKNSWYVDYIHTMTPADILPGVTEFLAILAFHKLPCAIGTASRNASLILEKIGLADFFPVVIDGNRVNRAKPDPEVFLRAAEGLNTAPEDCVVFEDAIAGIEAAQRADMKCVGVGDPQILGKADKVIPGFLGQNIELILF